jgi:hypothetical protein
VQGYIAREEDVRNAIAFYYLEGTLARRRSSNKYRKMGNLSHPG